MIREKLSLLAAVLILLGFPVFSQELSHVLQSGETLYSVSQSYGVSLRSVLEVNGLSEEDAKLVHAGRRLRIPSNAASSVKGSQGSAEKSAYEEYSAQKGDTLYGIARRSGISFTELLDINGFSPSYVLKEGDRLRVPFSVSAVPAPSSPSAAPPSLSIPLPAETPKPPSAVPAKIDNSIRWPVRPKEISYLTGKLYGVMVTGERSEPVRSLTQGTVVSAGPYRGFGRVVIIQVSGGYQYVYGGCESLSVKEGDKVSPGAELGKLGLDTKTEKPQLFFLVYRSNNPIDPAKAPRA